MGIFKGFFVRYFPCLLVVFWLGCNSYRELDQLTTEAERLIVQRDYDMAATTLQKAKSLVDDKVNPFRKMRLYGDFGTLSMLTSDYKGFIGNNGKVLSIFQSLEGEPGINELGAGFTAYINQAAFFSDMGRLQDATESLSKAQAVLGEINQRAMGSLSQKGRLQVLLDQSQASVLRKRGDTAGSKAILDRVLDYAMVLDRDNARTELALIDLARGNAEIALSTLAAKDKFGDSPLKQKIYRDVTPRLAIVWARALAGSGQCGKAFMVLDSLVESRSNSREEAWVEQYVRAECHLILGEVGDALNAIERSTDIMGELTRKVPSEHATAFMAGSTLGVPRQAVMDLKVSLLLTTAFEKGNQ